MSPQDMRSALISRTISVIAKDGLDKTTTKAIVSGTGINEAYIYRNFSDKEGLLIKTFESLDEDLLKEALLRVKVMYMKELAFETRCRIFYDAIWRFLLGNREKCLAFVRYYYSPYFQKYSASSHQKRYEPLVKTFSEAFTERANVWMLLNHILSVMLDFAIKVYDGAVPDDEDTSEHVFRLLYFSVSPYFQRNNEIGSSS